MSGSDPRNRQPRPARRPRLRLSALTIRRLSLADLAQVHGGVGGIEIEDGVSRGHGSCTMIPRDPTEG
jgi:hypothetical protein